MCPTSFWDILNSIASTDTFASSDIYDNFPLFIYLADCLSFSSTIVVYFSFLVLLKCQVCKSEQLLSHFLPSSLGVSSLTYISLSFIGFKRPIPQIRVLFLIGSEKFLIDLNPSLRPQILLWFITSSKGALWIRKGALRIFKTLRALLSILPSIMTV